MVPDESLSVLPKICNFSEYVHSPKRLYYFYVQKTFILRKFRRISLVSTKKCKTVCLQCVCIIYALEMKMIFVSFIKTKLKANFSSWNANKLII